MTSEVVVMNSLGVALAADSAATVSDVDGGRKTFNSADKLFMLSKRHPIGVMVYANAAIMGVPWETIIKMFRRHLGSDVYPKLEDYGRALVAYLNQNEALFPKDVQERHYLASIAQLFAGLKEESENTAFDRFNQGEPYDETLIAASIILAKRKEWRDKDDASCIPEGLGKSFSTRFSGEVHKLILKVFSELGLESSIIDALYELAGLIVSKEDIFEPTFSGLVVAGFGEDEHFPVMQVVEIGHVYDGNLKCRYRDVVRVDDANPSHVEPFADGDMVKTFLHGINPRFEMRMTREVASLVFGLPDAVLDAIDTLSEDEKARRKKELVPEVRKALRSVLEKLTEHREKKH